MSEVQTKQPARIGYYDRLRVLAITAVILIHVCGSAALSLIHIFQTPVVLRQAFFMLRTTRRIVPNAFSDSVRFFPSF